MRCQIHRTTPPWNLCRSKVLKEQLRRFKARAVEAERSLAAQETQLAAANEAARRLRAQLADVGDAADAAAAEAAARQQADSATRALEVGWAAALP